MRPAKKRRAILDRDPSNERCSARAIGSSIAGSCQGPRFHFRVRKKIRASAGRGLGRVLLAVGSDRIGFAMGSHNVTVREPLGDLYSSSEPPAASGQGKRLDRQVAAGCGHLKSPSGPVPHTAGQL